MRKHEEVGLFLLATVCPGEQTIMLQNPEYSVSRSKEKNYSWQKFYTIFWTQSCSISL